MLGASRHCSGQPDPVGPLLPDKSGVPATSGMSLCIQVEFAASQPLALIFGRLLGMLRSIQTKLVYPYKAMLTVRIRSFLLVLALQVAVQIGRGQPVTVYDSLNPGATGAVSQPASGDPIYGDTLTLAAGGKLVNFGAALYNSSSGGNTGTIYAGNTTVRFYDNTIPYTSGPITNTLLGTATLFWDYNDSGG